MALNAQMQSRPISRTGYAPFARHSVDIIVPFHGHIDRVARLVSAILLVTRSNPYQICLVDDASPNKDFIEQAKKIPQVLPIRLNEQVGFGGALEAGFRATQQPWVLFVHSDVVPEDGGWMLRLGESLLALRQKNVRLMSARSNNPGDERLVGRKGELGEDVVLEDGAIPLFCAMCHRELFNRIGGFIKSYPYAMYEDEELAHRMRYFKFKQGICGKSWVRHEGGVTINTLLQKKPYLRQVMEGNREKCISDIKKYK